MAEVAKEARAAAQYEVYFFTDLQRSTWQDVEPDASVGKGDATSNPSPPASQINTRLTTLAERAAVTVMDVGQVEATNLAVTRAAPSEPFVTTEREVSFAATLQQFGQQPRPACRVELLVDNVPVAQNTVDVPAGGEASVRFTHRFNTPGDHTVEARAAGDQLTMDDSAGWWCRCVMKSACYA